jgi:hypothetical protein
MPRRALLIGIDRYTHLTPLRGCVADAQAMQKLLAHNEDGSPNYECHLLTSSETGEVTKKDLRIEWTKLFASFDGDILFYFSGHGTPLASGGFLVTQEGDQVDPGLPMDELLILANKSKAKSILLILDCCHAGHLGGLPALQGSEGLQTAAYLREGLTILAAARPEQAAIEMEGHGVFTKLLLGALSGGAADVRGRISAASIYAYAEQAMGSWDQRPLYKSHADRLDPVRLCTPAVPDTLLRELPKIFRKGEDSSLRLDPSFEFTHPTADPDHVGIFDKLKILRNARLLTTEENKDLYFVALESQHVWLTPLGQFYWRLAELDRIRS